MALIYFAGNNDLKNEAIKSIIHLQKGINQGKNLLVFIKTDNDHSHLLQINASTSSRIEADTLISYGDENSSDPRFLSQVISDSRRLRPAQHYGLILWSHGTAWLPSNDQISTKSFGYDQGKEMDLISLSSALPNDFEYIIFDACYMGSVEVLYELKNKAQFILSSPAEILVEGFPYEKIANKLFDGVTGLKQITHDFIEFYKNKTGNHSSATICLVQTVYLDELSQVTKEIVEANSNTKLKTDNVQKLAFQAGFEYISAYDLLDCVKKNFKKNDEIKLREVLNRTIIAKGHTDSFLGKKIETFCGISVHASDFSKSQNLNYYQELSWDKDTNWSSLY